MLGFIILEFSSDLILDYKIHSPSSCVIYTLNQTLGFKIVKLLWGLFSFNAFTVQTGFSCLSSSPSSCFVFTLHRGGPYHSQAFYLQAISCSTPYKMGKSRVRKDVYAPLLCDRAKLVVPHPALHRGKLDLQPALITSQLG